MNSYHNIDKHPIHPKTYIGYTSKGFGRRITKSNNRPGLWIATPHGNEPFTAVSIYAANLRDMSAKLSSFS